MRYVRFQSRLPNTGTASKIGIFQTAYKARACDDTLEHDRNEIAEKLSTFDSILDAPDELELFENKRAICWFKDNARTHLQCAWSLKHHLEENGYWIDVVTSETPGQIIYEDRWQIAAKPWRKRRR